LHGQKFLLLKIHASLLFSDSSIASALCCGEMPTSVELPPFFHASFMRKIQMAFENQQDLNFHDQGGNNGSASCVGPMRRSDCSLLPGDANIGGMTAICSCQFHEKQETSKWLLKPNKILNVMTKEAMTLLPAVAVGWAGPTQRPGCSFLPGDANVSEMAAIVLPCHFHEEETNGFWKPTRRSQIAWPRRHQRPSQQLRQAWLAWHGDGASWPSANVNDSWNGSHSPCPRNDEMLKSSMKFNVSQPGWNGPHAIRKIFGVADKRPLVRIKPAKLAKAKRKRLADSLAISSCIWWVSKSIHKLLETTNSMEPASFLNDPTSETNVDECHHLRHQIVLQDKWINWRNFRASEVKPPAPALFSFAKLPFQFCEISTNQLAFWMFLHLKPTLKNAIVSAIEFHCRMNQLASVTFDSVKQKHQDRPSFVCWTSIPTPWNFSKPPDFLNVPASETDIEECHHLRHQILLQEESIHECDFQAGEVKPPALAIFNSLKFHSNSMKFQPTNQLSECSNVWNQHRRTPSSSPVSCAAVWINPHAWLSSWWSQTPSTGHFVFAELSFHLPEISRNQLAFWMFQHPKSTLQNAIVSAINFCKMMNQLTSVNSKWVKCKHQDWPIFVPWTPSIPTPWHFNQPTGFLNVPTSQTNIEACHRLCHRIMLPEKSIQWQI
jgi:hypothetical protein